jgi:hypothetical protein
MLPISSTQFDFSGIYRATGLPCLVINTPSGGKLSNKDKNFFSSLEASILRMRSLILGY